MDENKKVAIVTNAADLFPEESIIEKYRDGVSFFAEKGYQVERLDLRKYFGKKGELSDKLDEYGLVWVRGGNAFVLRRAMRQSGFDEVIKKKLNEDKIVYGGYSAGCCVLSPTNHGLEFVDDPLLVPEGYDAETIWDGLGVLAYVFVPHYKSDHPESMDVDKTVHYLTKAGIPFKALRDGQVFIIDGKRQEVIG